jgi:hypothetical protein
MFDHRETGDLMAAAAAGTREKLLFQHGGVHIRQKGKIIYR